ncbi:MAG TPA: hypothetical protein VIM16_00505 [Mucilaginibacter sp.]|jgi:hypothetical protein
MKKALLFFIIISGASQLKAQQLFELKPADSSSNNLFKIKPNKPFPLFQPQLNLNQNLGSAIAKNFISKVDHMPVIALNGNSKMPVVKLGGYSKMPIKEIGSEDQFPAGKKNQEPGTREKLLVQPD